MKTEAGRGFILKLGIAAACLLCLVLESSCAVPGLTAQNSWSSYCTLLHVTSGPPVIKKPKPFLGILFGPRNVGRTASLCKERSTFIEIAEVLAGSPAARAGLRKGDVVLAVDGKPLCSEKGDVGDIFKDMLDEKKPGAVVKLEIMRGKKRFPASTRLVEAPLHEQPEAAHPRLAECPPHSHSALERELHKEDAISSFGKILAGLRDTSNEVHNAAWFVKGPYNPFQLKEFTYLIRHPLEDGQTARQLTDGMISAAGGKDFHVEPVVRRASLLLDAGMPAEGKAEITLPGLIRAMEMVKRKLDKSFGRLSPDEKRLLREKALNPWDDGRWNDIVTASMKINVRELLNSFSPLLPFFSRESMSLLRKDLIARFGKGTGRPILYEAETPVGRVIVGGTGPNVYRKNAALILDLGGNDVYLNNAGGTRSGIPVAIVIDWGGNDLYLSKENFSQGAGLLGGGFLFDLSGDDVFDSLDGSQGAGFFGMGILYHGDGRAVFKARTYSQGVGEMGEGIIINGDGDTRYLCSMDGQGLGLFKGLGMLMDEEGDDYYQLGGLVPDFRDPARSTVSMGQGFGWGIRPEGDKYGVSGGIGLLIDEEGNDTYDADYFAQGASYYYGAGILSDLSGNDRYISGRYSQGAGIHSSVGILEDRGGNDFYYSSFGVSQGMGHDYGVGYLEDYRGNDTYIGGILSQGAATRGGVGILTDGGGKDRFMCSSQCQAAVENEKCIGILADSEPEDDTMSRYIHPERVRIGLKEKLSAVSSQP